MNKYEHGGDIYEIPGVARDFSISCNPLGMPDAVARALKSNTRLFSMYPDPRCRKLRTAISDYLSVPEEMILCGNGSADLINRICACFRPSRALVTAPSFSDYERCVEVFGGKVTEYHLYPEEGFNVSSSILDYIDDEISSYSDIFDNDETDADEEAKMRVISALKGLAEENDLENYLNTEEIIRYFVAHNFILNYDSYTGNMLHNYYLYENDGKLSMLPWDYNLAFGGFSGNGGESGGVDTTSLVNTGIDTPLSGVTEEARPMWNWIVSNENYLETYHSIFDSLISGYFESGKFESEIDSLYEMLYPYVEKDPSAFYSADEFTTAYKTMKEFCLLRAESIRLQLNGNLSTKSDEQDSSNQVDASGINIRSMGSQGGGREDSAGGFGNMPQMNIPSMPNQENNSQSATPTEPDK